MEPLIYIEQKDKDEASLLLKGFTNQNIKKRAFINALGAELLMKFLSQEGINIANIYNMHNIFKIREEFDIADVMLPNIHIDVRVVYDKDLIFIPKSHFKYNLVPDVYVVFNMSQDSTHVDFLGFFKPEVIDKSKQNEDYYFVNKEQLIHPFEFVEFVRSFNGNTTETFSDEVYVDVLSLIDNDIDASKKEELIGLLKKSAALREEMIEFDNFEWLSYNASREDIIDTQITEEPVKDEFDFFEEKDEFDFEGSDEGLEVVENAVEAGAIAEGVESAEEVLDATDMLDDLSLPKSDLDDTELAATSDFDSDEESAEEGLNADVDIEESAEDLNIEGTTEEPVEELENIDIDNVDIDNIDVSEDLSMDIEPLEGLENADMIEDLPEVDNLESIEETSEFNEEAEPVESLEDLVEPQELSDIPEISDENNEPVEDGGFTEELENLTDILEEPQDNIEEISEVVPDNTTEADETLEDLTDLETLAEPVVSDETSTEAQEGALEELISLDDINFNNEETSEVEEVDNFVEPSNEIAELEAYTNNETEEIESVTNIVESASDDAQTEEYESYESSNIISSDSAPGEISIDMNNSEQEDIGVLYNNNESEIETVSTNVPEKGKKAVMVAAAAVAAVMIAASSAYFYFNNKQPEVAETATVVPEPEPQVEEQPVPEEDVVTEAPKKAQAVEEAKQEPNVSKPIESAYMDVKKMGWSVPDYVTYNDGFKHYLQTLGKSMRLALSSDLLLATEYPYSDQIFVDIDLSNNGSVSGVKISKSSGSKQIDDIVLRTVKETTNVVKPPAGVIVGDKLHMTLKIYL